MPSHLINNMNAHCGNRVTPCSFLSTLVIVFSAKGAALISSLRQRPRDLCSAKPPVRQPPDDSFRSPICVGLTVNRSVESRFQRLFIIGSKSRRGELHDIAPSSLNRHLPVRIKVRGEWPYESGIARIYKVAS